jgi:hypothetical protein
MKTDSGEFKKRVEEAKERSKKIDALRVEVIKCHLLVEEALDTFIGTSLYYPDYLRQERLNFHLKGNLALSLSLKEDKDPLWAVFWAINYLRNKIAHNLDSEEIEEKMKFLRKTYIDTAGSNQKADAEKLSDIELVKDACWLVAGLFGQLTMDAKGRRAVIDQHWKGRSEQGMR